MSTATTGPGALRGAAQDFVEGTKAWESWLTLAWYDVLLRYRRSMLGPLWITISMGIMLLGIGPL
ncbi:MAG: ABC transporter permease, partial [Phycisphaerales bacterium]